uniref:PDZ domain-containing protein n=1 Tax=Trichuris muris TaxID=70415 RepID=A0A5S6QE47_TRIMR
MRATKIVYAQAALPDYHSRCESIIPNGASFRGSDRVHIFRRVVIAENCDDDPMKSAPSSTGTSALTDERLSGRRDFNLSAVPHPLKFLRISRSNSSSRPWQHIVSRLSSRSQSEQCLSKSRRYQDPSERTAVQSRFHQCAGTCPSACFLPFCKMRRNIVIPKRRDGMFGFTLQSYVFERLKYKTLERTTYVDHVAIDSPSFDAGLRCGDIILSINGTDVHNFTHQELIKKIKGSKSLHMTVLFSNNMEKIELYSRSIKLLNLLVDKEFELSVLDKQEERLKKKLPLLSGQRMLELMKDSFPSAQSVNIPVLKVRDGNRVWDAEEDGISSNERHSAVSLNPVSSHFRQLRELLRVDNSSSGSRSKSSTDDGRSLSLASADYSLSGNSEESTRL